MRHTLIFLALAALGTLPLRAHAACAEPTVFSPGVISGPAHDSAPAFTPEGQEVIFGRSTNALSMILVSRKTAQGWSAPVPAPFSGQWLDMEPAMAPDGSYLVFVSNRPHEAGGAPLDGGFDGKPAPGKGAHLWRVNRTKEGGWGVPFPLPDTVNSSTAIYAPSIAADGSVYFMKPGGPRNRFQIYRAQRSGDGFLAPVPMPFNDESTSNVDPAVAPDESFLVFGSGRKPARDMDLFIVARHGTGSDTRWGCPLHMGPVVNSAGSDAEPRLSPDGKTLYFSSERMTPVPMPMAPADTAQALQRLAWDNGLYNIWQTDLAPWIDAAARQPAC